MATSQNGWPIVGPEKIYNGLINGFKYPNGFLKGDVTEAFTWLFTQLDKRVEKTILGNPADEWGYYVKKIEGTTTQSNHGSGTAGDYNATLHPMGVKNTYHIRERSIIRDILKEADGIFRWGGNYEGRPDDMHFEIIKGSKEVAAFVSKIRPQGNYLLDIPLIGSKLPTLRSGDRDDKHAGYNYVSRAQCMLNYLFNGDLKIDGWYAEKTQALVIRLNPPGDGRTIGKAEWAQLYGL